MTEFLHQQAQIIETLLKKYTDAPVTEELQKNIWEELQKEKYFGRITIPFKVIRREGTNPSFPPYIEVLLDTKI